MLSPNYKIIREAPFNLTGTSYDWVKETLEG
jgi:hypothetical protein